MWVFGVLLALIASAVSSLGVNFQKLSFSRNAALPREKQRKYLQQPMWMLGMGLVVFGSLFDFAALSLAAQSIVAPIASVNLVANVFFAHYCLHETLNWRELVGTLLIVAGSVLAVAFGDHSSIPLTSHEIVRFASSLTFVIYFIIALVIGIAMYSYCRIATPIKTKIAEAITRYDRADAVDDTETMQVENGVILELEADYAKYEKIHPFCLCALSGIFGGQSMMFGKIVSSLFSTTLQGSNQLFNVWFPLCLICMISTVMSQVHFLAVALNFFDALYVVPVFQCFFISVSTIGGASFFGEFSNFSATQGVFFTFGLLMTLGGVMVLSSRKMSRHIVKQTENESEPINGVALTYAEDPNRGWYGITYSGERWKENTTKKRTVIPFPVTQLIKPIEEEKQSIQFELDPVSSNRIQSVNPFESVVIPKQTPVIETSQNPFEFSKNSPVPSSSTPSSSSQSRASPSLSSHTPGLTPPSRPSQGSPLPSLPLNVNAASNSPVPTPSARGKAPETPFSLPSARGVQIGTPAFSSVSPRPGINRTPSIQRTPEIDGYASNSQSPSPVPVTDLPPPVVDMFSGDETVVSKVRRFTSLSHHVGGLIAQVPFVTAFAHAYAMTKEEDQRLQAEAIKEQAMKALEVEQAERDLEANSIESKSVDPNTGEQINPFEQDAKSVSSVPLPAALPFKTLPSSIPALNPPPLATDFLESGPSDITVHSRMKINQESFPSLAPPPVQSKPINSSNSSSDMDAEADILASGSSHAFLSPAQSANNLETAKSLKYNSEPSIIIFSPFGLQSAMQLTNRQANQSSVSPVLSSSADSSQFSPEVLEDDGENDSEGIKQSAPTEVLPSLDEEFESI
jgi:hypothetical protein